jgi:hypothetical protein
VADRSLRTIVVVTLALVAPIFALPRVAAAETAIVNGFSPIVGWAVFDFGRTDRLRAKLAQAERRQAAAESRELAAEARARAAETSVRIEHAASESQHAAYERAQAAHELEHTAYERELATIAAYRKQSDVQRDRLARVDAQNTRAAYLFARTAPKPTACSLVAAVPMPPRHPAPAFHHPSPALHHPSSGLHSSPAVHHPAKRIVAAPRSPEKDARSAAMTRNRSVGWGAI